MNDVILSITDREIIIIIIIIISSSSSSSSVIIVVVGLGLFVARF